MYTNIKCGKKLEEILEKYKIEIDNLFDKLTKATLTKKADEVANEGLNDDPKTDNNETDNNEDDNDSAKLDKKDLAELTKQIKKQIELIKTRFYKEVDMYVKKNSTDKLEELSFLTKKQFDDHVYSKYEEMYKQVNDKTALTKIIKIRKDIGTKMAEDIKKINADKSVESSEKNNSNININKGYNYIYNNSKGKKIYVNVLEIDKDENGKKNDLLAEVINKEESNFFVLKNRLSIIKKGDKFNYFNKKGESIEVEVIDADYKGNVTKVKTESCKEFDPIDSNLS